MKKKRRKDGRNLNRAGQNKVINQSLPIVSNQFIGPLAEYQHSYSEPSQAASESDPADVAAVFGFPVSSY